MAKSKNWLIFGFAVFIFFGLLVIGCGQRSDKGIGGIKVIFRDKALGASGVSTTDSLSIGFDSPIDNGNFTLSNNVFTNYGSTHTAGTPELSSATLTFSSDKRMILISGIKSWSKLTNGAGSKEVEVVAGSGKIKGLSGQELSAGTVLWKFNLAMIGTTDTAAPTISLISPESGASNVALDTNISAVFSEDMDSSTMTTSNFTISSSLGALAGAVSYSSGTKTITFNPTSLLANAYTYTATIGTGAKDTAGNTLETAHSWTFTSSLPASVLYYTKDYDATNSDFGISVAGAGDVNKDGYDDFIVGALTADPGGVVNAGSAYVYSGLDGSLLYQKDGEATDNYFGSSVAGAGDVNKDGYDDFIVGARRGDPGGLVNAGSAYVYSGSDGSLLYQKNGTVAGDAVGYSVDGAGDINSDGYDDFIIGAYNADPGGLADAGSAYVYSGVDGSLLYQKNGGAASDFFGSSAAGAGDVNGDGKADFIVGAYGADPGGVAWAGSVYVYSGVDGALLYQKDGAAAGDLLGLASTGAGDVNGDGRDDFIIGARGVDSGRGSAYVYSGVDGSLLYQKDGVAAGDFFGISAAGAGDVNGDGRADFIVGAVLTDPGGLADAGSAYLYSGSDGSLLYQRNGGAAGDYFGWAVAMAGDINADGKADFIVGAPYAAPGGLSYAGSAYVYISQ